MHDQPPAMDLPWSAFQMADDDGNRWLAQITIMGVPMHLEAWRVEYVHGSQEPMSYGDEFADIQHAVGADGPFMTIKIDEDEFVLIATPHCD